MGNQRMGEKGRLQTVLRNRPLDYIKFMEFMGT
jgi:hypothetical protein